jgi:integrase
VVRRQQAMLLISRSAGVLANHTTWRSTLRRAGVPHFPIYNLRHAFCTRLSWVAPDAVIERAMRHTSPETKRIYQLSMVEQVREAMEKANQRVYGDRVTVH